MDFLLLDHSTFPSTKHKGTEFKFITCISYSGQEQFNILTL